MTQLTGDETYLVNPAYQTKGGPDLPMEGPLGHFQGHPKSNNSQNMAPGNGLSVR